MDPSFTTVVQNMYAFTYYSFIIHYILLMLFKFWLCIPFLSDKRGIRNGRGSNKSYNKQQLYGKACILDLSDGKLNLNFLVEYLG